jgi:antitoxin MazE
MELTMIVSKWGNSLAVRLPRKLVEEMGLAPGDELEIVDVSKRRLMVEKDQRRKRAVDRMRARRWTLPADYKFDRDEANER